MVRASSLEDFAQPYVDQYFAPPEEMRLSVEGESRAEALAHFSVGRMQENRGQTAKAVESYLRVLELQPGNLSLARKCAYLLARSGNQVRARELLENALKENPDRAMPFIMLSEFLSTYHSNDQDNKDRSLDLARQAVQKFPRNAVTYEHLVKMFLVGDRREEARELLGAALETANADAEFWLRLGKVAGRVWPLRLGVEGGDRSLGILNRFYVKATEHAGEDDSVRERSADFFLTTRQYDRAEGIYRKLIERRTDRLDLRKKLARVYAASGDDDAYLETLLGIVEIDRGDVATHREIAESYEQAGDIPNAVKHRKIALDVGKGTAGEYEALAEMMVNSEMNDEAIDFLDEAAYLFPENPYFHWLITFPLRRLDRYEEAAEYFESCEKIAGEHRPQMLNERFYFQFGATVERAGDIDRAARLFQKTIGLIGRKDPDQEQREFTAQVYNYLGYMWIENDMNIDEAGELIKTAVDLDPENGAIADSLGWFYFKKGRYVEAMEELMRSETLIEEPDAVIFDHIGQTYHALGNLEKAVEYMEKAVELEPDKAEYGKRLAQYRNQLAGDASPQPEQTDIGQ